VNRVLSDTSMFGTMSGVTFMARNPPVAVGYKQIFLSMTSWDTNTAEIWGLLGRSTGR